MLKKMLLLLLVMFFASSTAHAGVTLTYSSAGTDYFTMVITDGWKINVGAAQPATADGDEAGHARIMTAMPDDATPLWFGLWVPAGVHDFAEAGAYVDSLQPIFLDHVQPGQRRIDELNGMAVLYFNGVGKKGEEEMDYYGAFIQLSNSTVAMAIYIGPHASTVSHGEGLRLMFNSI